MERGNGGKILKKENKKNSRRVRGKRKREREREREREFSVGYSARLLPCPSVSPSIHRCKVSCIGTWGLSNRSGHS